MPMCCGKKKGTFGASIHSPAVGLNMQTSLCCSIININNEKQQHNFSGKKWRNRTPEFKQLQPHPPDHIFLSCQKLPIICECKVSQVHQT